MIVPIDLLLLFFLLIIGIAALWVKDLLAAIVLTGGYSFVMANMWLEMGATDVSIYRGGCRCWSLNCSNDGLFIESSEVEK